MPASSRHLRMVAVDATALPPTCRVKNCAFAAESALGFCEFCQRVYDAARELHCRRTEWCWARIEDAWQPLLSSLTADRRDRLQRHVAAHAAEPGGLTLRAIEDFLAELHGLHSRGQR